jgi:hypothetical protein
MTSQPREREMRLSATAKAKRASGHAHERAPTATASTSSLKPSPWTDASLSASLPKRPNKPLGGLHSPPFFLSLVAREHFDFQTQTTQN